MNLKAFRQAKGWSLDRTALETGVSKAMLGQIEREESSPTISTLWKIAKGFHLSFSSFLEAAPKETGSFSYRSKPSPNLHAREEKIEVATIFPYDKQTNSEIFLLKLHPGCEHLSLPHDHGVIEQVIGIDGEIEVLINGAWQPISEGTGIRFNADQPHGYRNNKTKIASFYNVIHYLQK